MWGGWREFSIKNPTFFSSKGSFYKTDITQKATLLQYFLLSYAWLLPATQLLSSRLLTLLIFAGVVGRYRYTVKFSIYCYGMQKWPFCVHLFFYCCFFLAARFWTSLWYKDVNMNETKSTKIYWKSLGSNPSSNCFC